MTQNIPILIGAIIDKIRDTYPIVNITHSGTIYTINTSDTKRLEVGSYVTISGNNYDNEATTYIGGIWGETRGNTRGISA
jgi:hypothetical protein